MAPKIRYLKDVNSREIGSTASTGTTGGAPNNYINRKVVSANFDRDYYDPQYDNDLVQYEGDLISAVNKLDYVDAVLINDSYAIIIYKNGRLKDVRNNVPEIVYVTTIRLYTPEAIRAIDDAQISQFHTNTLLNLTGSGTVIAIIDSGIDYLNTEFQYEDNTSRILAIWDQTIREGKVPPDFGYGSEYLKEDIDRAILAKNTGTDPYLVVPSRDLTGHGTGVAGIAGARGINVELTGAAPDANFIIVKVKETTDFIKTEQYGNIPVDVPVYREIDVIMGIKYAYEYSVRSNRPLVIVLPVGTNIGSHGSRGFIENYLDSLIKRRGFAVVAGTGNEGDKGTHTSGIIPRAGVESQATFEVMLEAEQKNIIMMVWLNKPDRAKLAITSPSGEFIDRISPKFEVPRSIKFVSEGTTVEAEYFLPEELTGDEAILIKIRDIATGVWSFNLIGETIMNGRYDVWIPQSVLLTPGTRFLAPTQETTLTVPSNAEGVISTAYYNQNNDAIVAASGRGYTRNNQVKPDLTTGGVEVLTTGINNQTQIMTGSSAATAVVGGAVALLFQWGIVDGKDPTLYSEKVKTYLISGTRKIQGVEYPNPIQGYGILDLEDTFLTIRDVDTATRSIESYDELNSNNARYKNININDLMK